MRGDVRCDTSYAMRDEGLEAALLEERVLRNMSEGWRLRGPSLALGPTGWMEKLGRKQEDRSRNTTQRRPRDAKKDTIYDEGEACAAFLATAVR